MKWIAICVLLISTTNSNYGQSNIDVLHYKFEIGLSDKDDTLRGKAVITVKFNQRSNRFSLSLSSRTKGKGMAAYLVRENGEAVTSTHEHDSLLIVLNKPANTGDARTFEILYSGIPADGLIISRNRHGDRTFFADNWPNRAHNWIPCKDELDDKATFEFVVTAPSQYRVISNGKLEEEKDLGNGKKLTRWKEDVSLPTKVMVIGVARFAVREFGDSPPGVPVSGWVYPQDSVPGFRSLAAAPGIVKFFSNFIGPYPYNKLANVQSKTIFGGMENASAIFYNEDSIAKDNIEGLLAHEIAHQWFGDMTTEKEFSHLWLSEGFATYLADVYLESKYGPASLDSRLREEREIAINFAKVWGKPVVDSVSSLMRLLNPNSYEKGGWILHMLRREMGDSTFRIFIRTYYDRFKGKNADTEDLQKVAEEISGKNLEQFFKQWLYTPGIPQINIQWRYSEKDKNLFITVVQEQKQAIFQFPLEIKLETSKDPEVVRLHVSQKSETFTIPVASTVHYVDPDPNTSLLFEEVKR